MIDRVLRCVIGFPHLLRRMQYPLLARRLEQLHLDPQKSTLLDIGCGAGELTQYLSSQAYCVGVEPDQIPRPVPGRSFFLRAHGESLPFPDQFFDVVVMSSVLQMVVDESKLLSESKRVLKKGGHILLTVPVEYRFIPKLFGNSLLQKVFRLPSSLEEFRASLNQKHKAAGRGYFDRNSLMARLKTSDLKLISEEYAPRSLGTFLYEMCLLIRWAWGLNVSVYGFAGMILYPIGWLDRFLPPTSRGCEMLVDVQVGTLI